jgi:hypothetical protein
MADEEMLPLMQAEGLSLTEAYQRTVIAGDGAHQAD